MHAAHQTCEEFAAFDSNVPDDLEFASIDKIYDDYLEAFGLFKALSDSYALEYKFPRLGSGKIENVNRIRRFFYDTKRSLDEHFTKLTVEKYKNKFSISLGRTFAYEFSEGDLARVQSLINDLRERISNSKLFQDDHRTRLLKRLERLQFELHKKVSDLDRFWGLIGDAGVVLRKFGEDAKPIFDRIRELTWIIWLTQTRAEGLPSDCAPSAFTTSTCRRDRNIIV
jgi:hypothetical protein